MGSPVPIPSVGSQRTKFRPRGHRKAVDSRRQKYSTDLLSPEELLTNDDDLNVQALVNTRVLRPHRNLHLVMPPLTTPTNLSPTIPPSVSDRIYLTPRFGQVSNLNVSLDMYPKSD